MSIKCIVFSTRFSFNLSKNANNILSFRFVRTEESQVKIVSLTTDFYASKYLYRTQSTADRKKGARKIARYKISYIPSKVKYFLYFFMKY